MKKIKFTKETFALALILALSAVLNFANISIEGYSNGYYAAAVKSMLMSFKNFFFVSFDPAGFVTIDKPPLGFWIQTISAKIFGFSGWSILLPQAVAGVVSVGLVYYLVKRSFGSIAGLISALCLAVTPVFVAASRNNTIDNLLVVTLLFACWALSIAAEKGKVKYLMISLVLVGLGFNIKMLEAYMIAPAIYITYLLTTAVSVKKKILHLAAGTAILIAVSLSWAVVVDLVPAQSRPYIDSSTNNSVMELILGHNGLERLGLGSSSTHGGGGPVQDSQRVDGQNRRQNGDGTDTASGATQNNSNQGNPGQGMPGGDPNGNGQSMQSGGSNNNGQGPGGMGFGRMDGNMQPPSGGGQGGPGGQGGLQGSFGGQTPAGIARLFSKNVLSDQIVWFLPLAVLGFAAAVIKEKLRFPFDDRRKLDLILWIVWLVPEFIYFSYTKGLFHPYYLTMMAPPIAALAGIGITSMWELFNKGGWKAWILPGSFIIEGLTQLLMLSYFGSSISTAIKTIITASLMLCFAASAVLAVWNIVNLIKNKNNNFEDGSESIKDSKGTRIQKVLVGMALFGTLVTPFIGASAPITHKLSSGIPSAGLELLSSTQMGDFGKGNGSNGNNAKLIEFLKDHITNEKYSLVVSNSGSAEDIIIQSGEPVMALGGFSGSDKTLTLNQFKDMVKKGEVRYVLSGGMGGGSSSNEIMNWVAENGKVVSESEWKDSSSVNSQTGVADSNDKNLINLQNQNTSMDNNKNSDSQNENFKGFNGRNSGQLYDLKDSIK